MAAPTFQPDNKKILHTSVLGKAVEPHAMPGILFFPQSKFALLKQQLQAMAGELCFAVVILAVALIYICNIWKMRTI